MNLNEKLALLESYGITVEPVPWTGEHAFAATSAGGEELDVVYAADMEAAADILIKFFGL